MKLKELQREYQKLGETDPLWAILTCRDKKGKKWELDEFFATGEREVESIQEYINSLGLEMPRGQALDFGCGVGRVTQPLARHFDVCYGVDIAPSMLDLARQYNKWGDRCRYILNETDDLALFPDNIFDFIYSVITFQNMDSRYSRKYIQEFTRILAPYGLLIFQIPSEPKTIRQKIKHMLPPTLLSLFYKIKTLGRSRLEVHEIRGINRMEVIKLIEENGARILDVRRDQRAKNLWSSYRYCATKDSS